MDDLLGKWKWIYIVHKTVLDRLSWNQLFLKKGFKMIEGQVAYLMCQWQHCNTVTIHFCRFYYLKWWLVNTTQQPSPMMNKYSYIQWFAWNFILLIQEVSQWISRNLGKLKQKGRVQIWFLQFVWTDPLLNSTWIYPDVVQSFQQNPSNMLH